MYRTVPFEKKAKCDGCGALGAFDLMGDYFCSNCLEANLEYDEEYESEQGRDTDTPDGWGT